MKLLKFLLISTSTFFLFNQEGIAMHEEGGALSIGHRAAAASSPFSWTQEEKKWILGLVTHPVFNPSPSRNHPQEHFYKLGIGAVTDRKGTVESRRAVCAQHLFMNMSLAELGREDTLEKLKSQNCPRETVYAYLENLSGNRHYEYVEIFFKNAPSDLPPSFLDFYRGRLIKNLENSCSAAMPWYEKFLKWYKDSSTSLKGLFGDRHLSEAYTCIGLAYQKSSEKNKEVLSSFQRAFSLYQSPTTARNLADWYRALEDGVNADFYEKKAQEFESRGHRVSEKTTTQTVQCFRLPSGTLLPLGSREEGVEVGAGPISFNEAYEKYATTPLIAGRMMAAVSREYASLKGEAFRDHPDAKTIFRFETYALTQNDLVKSEDISSTLQRINERLPLVTLDKKICQELSNLWPKFSMTVHGSVIIQIQNTFRQRIVRDIEQGIVEDCLHSAHTSKIPGLAEEAAFLFRLLRRVSPEAPGGVSIECTDKSRVILDPLHMGLCAEKKVPYNVLQRLSNAKISSNSELFAYWKRRWEETHGVQEREAFESFWNELQSTSLTPSASVTRTVVGTGGRTGPKAQVSEDAVAFSDDSVRKYDAIALYHEARRRSSETESQIPEEVIGSLRLEVAPSERGGSRSMITLLKTNPGQEQEEKLASLHPHQLHASDRKAGEEVSKETLMTLLWNLHLLQREEGKVAH